MIFERHRAVKLALEITIIHFLSDIFKWRGEGCALVLNHFGQKIQLRLSFSRFGRGVAREGRDKIVGVITVIQGQPKFKAWGLAGNKLLLEIGGLGRLSGVLRRSGRLAEELDESLEIMGLNHHLTGSLRLRKSARLRK